jgi:hypothetical protein
MIKFFRKIRQKSLTENKFSKYLLYAIGEIVLVVFGILIALSINNWNDSRKEAKEESFLLLQLQQEFVNDSIQLRRLIRLTKIKTSKGKELRVMIKNDSIKVDSLVINVFFNGRLLQFNSYSPTFDEIISSGKSNVLKGKNLMHLIKRYKNNLEEINNYLYKENQKRKEEYNSHVFHYFDPELDTYLRRNLGNINVDEINKFKFNSNGFKTDPKTVYHINVQVGVDAQLNYTFNNQLLPQIENILKELRVELSR